VYNGGLNIMSDADADIKRGRLDKNVDEFVAGAADASKRPDGYKLNELTKTCFDILNATTTATMDAAINTLLQNDYDGARVGEKKEVLDMQFIALQNAPTGNANLRYEYKNGNKYENAEKANKAYDEGVNFLTYFDVDYSDASA